MGKSSLLSVKLPFRNIKFKILLALFAIFGKVNHFYNLMRLKLRVKISDLSVFQSVKMKSLDFLNISEYACLFDIYLMNCIFYKFSVRFKWS